MSRHCGEKTPTLVRYKGSYDGCAKLCITGGGGGEQHRIRKVEIPIRYVKERLKSSLRKFYGRYGDLTKQYEVPLSRMLHDILDDDHIQWHPPLIGHYANFWPLLIWTLLPNLTFYLIVQGFHRTYATGAACQQRTLTPSGHLVLSHLGFAFVQQTETTLPTCDAYRIWPIYRNSHCRIGEVSTEYMQRVWHASRGRWLLRTPGPVPLWDLHMF